MNGHKAVRIIMITTIKNGFAEFLARSATSPKNMAFILQGVKRDGTLLNLVINELFHQFPIEQKDSPLF